MKSLSIKGEKEMYPKGNRDEITKLMRKGIQRKSQFIKNRRDEEYDNKVEQWKSQKGAVSEMTKDSYWGFSSSPTMRNTLGGFKHQPKQISESKKFWNEVDQIIEELERD